MCHLFFLIEKTLFELIEKNDETPVKNVTKRLFMNTFNTPEQIKSVLRGVNDKLPLDAKEKLTLN